MPIHTHHEIDLELFGKIFKLYMCFLKVRMIFQVSENEDLY